LFAPLLGLLHEAVDKLDLGLDFLTLGPIWAEAGGQLIIALGDGLLGGPANAPMHQPGDQVCDRDSCDDASKKASDQTEEEERDAAITTDKGSGRLGQLGLDLPVE
jgi:hypothetical protein